MAPVTSLIPSTSITNVVKGLDLIDIDLENCSDTIRKITKEFTTLYGVHWKKFQKYTITLRSSRRGPMHDKSMFIAYGDFYGDNVTLFEKVEERGMKACRFGYNDAQTIYAHLHHGEHTNPKKIKALQRWANYLQKKLQDSEIEQEIVTNLSRVVFQFM